MFLAGLRTMEVKKVFKFVCVLALSISVFGVIEPLYFSIKASLAQRMLESAWTKSIQNPQSNVKPWPWADTWPVFKLTLIKRNSLREGGNQSFRQEDNNYSDTAKSYIVLADASGESLAFAPGLMTGTLYPGELGNSLIAAHRDTHFAFTERMTIGDLVEVEYKDGIRYVFEIDQLQIIDSRRESPIIDLDEYRVTLVTCYPFEQSSEETDLRLLLSGKLAM